MSFARKGPGRERQEKIIEAIFEVAGGTTRLCPYEDIVVQAWRMWPEEFGLRGYTDRYPDSSDLHKPLYGPLKREGLVRNQTKKFGLTQRGLAVAEQLRVPRDSAANGRGRVERDQKAELQRLGEREAVRLVVAERTEDLLDTDLYDFYGVTVRTAAGDFAGRVRTVDGAIDAAVSANDPSVDPSRLAAVVATRDELRTRFVDLITERSAAAEKTRT
jgi:hypothetical protein